MRVFKQSALSVEFLVVVSFYAEFLFKALEPKDEFVNRFVESLLGVLSQKLGEEVVFGFWFFFFETEYLLFKKIYVFFSFSDISQLLFQ